jgi:hypothetical protein
MFLLLGVASSAHAATTCKPLTLSVTPDASEESQPVSIVNSPTNCSASAKVITVWVAFVATTEACAIHSEAFSFKVLMQPKKTRTGSFTLPAPPCEGGYIVKEASSNAGFAKGTLTVN